MIHKKQQVALSLGSNIRRYHHINAGIKALKKAFGQVICSPVYESEAVGFQGDAFLNLIALIESNLSLSQIISILKRIEDDNGRDRSGPKFSARTLDIDVVTYGDHSGEIEGIELPRPELFKNAFVLKPMADLLPKEQVPGRPFSYLDLWVEQGDKTQKLEKIAFTIE